MTVEEAREELAAVDLAFEGLEETDRARRIGYWIGLAAAETTRANAAEAELASLRAKTAGGAADRPPPGLLMSMAMRHDHAIGHAGFYDRKPAGIGKPGSDPGGHAKRLSGTMNGMRQLWQEATGNGFYAPHKEADYRARAETCGVTFLESGFAIPAKEPDPLPLDPSPQGEGGGE